jgi:Dna[CI] antecedent, DciA
MIKNNNNQQSLSSLLKGIFRDESSRQMYFQTKIERAWQKQMGTTVNRHTQEITLRNKILYIKITSSSLKQELLYAKDTIIDFANKICEEECVSQVVIL